MTYFKKLEDNYNSQVQAICHHAFAGRIYFFFDCNGAFSGGI